MEPRLSNKNKLCGQKLHSSGSLFIKIPLTITKTQKMPNNGIVVATKSVSLRRNHTDFPTLRSKLLHVFTGTKSSVAVFS